MSPCQAERKLYPGREEARAQGPAGPSGSCERRGLGMSTTPHRAVPGAPRSQHRAETRSGPEQEAPGGFRAGRRESEGQ